ncbi:MAG TPA: bifunctional aspartate kinase/diaminopimelate decarboxylase [Pseudomonadota bacterium]|nr:bifunctional aspartate kinase/diaminopimelate decarboxylase [Pseudomonadota bacterium]
MAETIPARRDPQAPSDWIVLKFGGTSVSAKARWDNIVGLVRARQAEGARVLVVVSALSGVTNALMALVETARNGGDLDPAVNAVVARHTDFVHELGLPSAPALHEFLAQLAALAIDPRRAGAQLPWQAEVLALGELMSSSLGMHYLRACGLEAEWLDAREWLRAAALPNQSDWARWLSVSCATAPDAAMQAALARRSPVLITQGFIAADAQGHTTLLGRGGSDTSAAYFGALLKARRVEIWTDVAGMFSANPRQVAGARLLKRLDYEEAQEIAGTGAKVLHPRCLSPLRDARVPLCIKDTNRPDLAGTEVGAFAAAGPPSVKAISARSGITLVSMESVGMWQSVGFLADVFEAFKRHGLSVDLIGSAETNVTVSLDPTANLLNSDVLSALCADLERVCRVKVIAPCAAVTLVGRGMRGLLHRLGPVLAEFGQHNVHLISQSSNNLNLTFVVDEAVATPLVPQLHEMLVRAEAMRLDDEAVFGPTWDALYATTRERARPVPWWATRREALLAKADAGEPLYVYALDEVRATARRLRAIGAVDRWFYAMKANSHPQVLRTLAEEGFGIECVSAPELDAARAALPELAPDRLLFTPNFAPRGEYAKAYAMDVRVTVDNLHPLREWGEDFRARELLLRLDLGHGRGHHDKVVTGGAGSKFGLALADVEEFRERARALDCRITGLHAHLGSGVLDVAHFRETYAALAALAEQFPDVVRLNLGGGLGVPSRPEDQPLDLDALATALAEVRRHYPQYRVWMEPGRYPVAEAGVLLTRVTQVKTKGAHHYVGVDTGMNSLIRPALYDAWHPIVNLTRLADVADATCTIVGPICESGDVLGSNRRLPTPREGDVLLVAQAGAYGHVMASRYNLREPAAEVLL